MSLWTRQYEPKTARELVVNKVKVSEVDNFLKESIFGLNEGSGKRNILIILGPNGSGKTSTLYCLCKNYDIEILEWETPSGLKEGIGTSFYRFIVNSSFFAKSNSSRKSLILIKEFPFTLVQHSPQIINEIKCFLSIGCRNINCEVPIVFISDENRNDRLFLKSILPNYLDISDENISKNKNSSNLTKLVKLNPVPSTIVKSKLNHILSRRGLIVEHKDESIINEIVRSSNGDLCHAITQLQFYFADNDYKDVTKVTSESSNSSEFKKGRTKRIRFFTDSNQNRFFCNNLTLGKEPIYNVFRTIGKILYNKREGVAVTNIEERLNLLMKRQRIKEEIINHDENMELINPSFVNKYSKSFKFYSEGFGDISDSFIRHSMKQYNLLDKGKLSFDLEDLLMQSGADENTLTLLLQENYIPFIGNCVDIIKCSEIFSWSDANFTPINTFISDDHLSVLFLSCIARTILYFNSKPLNPCSNSKIESDKNIGFSARSSQKISSTTNINCSGVSNKNIRQSRFKWHPKKPFYKIYLAEIKSIRDDFQIYVDSFISKSFDLELINYSYFSKFLFTEVFPYLNIFLDENYWKRTHFSSKINEDLIRFIRNWCKYNKHISLKKSILCSSNLDFESYSKIFSIKDNAELTFGDYLSDEQLVSILETCDVENISNEILPISPKANDFENSSIIIDSKGNSSSDDSIDADFD